MRLALAGFSNINIFWRLYTLSKLRLFQRNEKIFTIIKWFSLKKCKLTPKFHNRIGCSLISVQINKVIFKILKISTSLTQTGIIQYLLIFPTL
jgi:hypothetical protein